MPGSMRSSGSRTESHGTSHCSLADKEINTWKTTDTMVKLIVHVAMAISVIIRIVRSDCEK